MYNCTCTCLTQNEEVIRRKRNSIVNEELQTDAIAVCVKNMKGLSGTGASKKLISQVAKLVFTVQLHHNTVSFINMVPKVGGESFQGGARGVGR